MPIPVSVTVKMTFVPVGTRLHFNLSAGRSVLQRVVEQILQDFAELRAIAANRRSVLLQVDMNLAGLWLWH